MFSRNYFKIIDNVRKAQFFKSLLVNEWSVDQKHQYHLGTCQKCII